MKTLIEPQSERHNGEINDWFELTYSHYLVLQRSILQEMPTEWQERFISCINEIEDYFEFSEVKGEYMVKLRDRDGRFVQDPLCNYRRPDMKYINNMKRVKPKEE